MPVYEYRCPSCRSETERLQRMDDPPPACAGCGTEMTRVLSVTGAILAEGRSGGDRAVPCCGEAGGCDQPKRCCTRG